MKKLTALSVAANIALLIVLVYGYQESIHKEKKSSSYALTVTPGDFHYFEKYTGVIDGKPTTLVILETAYVLANGERGNAKVGAINTARGFERDEDATVYELDRTQEAPPRHYFVRLTSDKDRIFKLDPTGKIMTNSFLTASGSTP